MSRYGLGKLLPHIGIGRRNRLQLEYTTIGTLALLYLEEKMREELHSQM